MSIKLDVWGDYALFTRPEFKSERVSYDVPTPSAVIGLLESIYWHPGVKYVIEQIYVNNPIKFANICRNELTNTIPRDLPFKKRGPLFTVTSDEIQQRNSRVLKDVHYGIVARVEADENANWDVNLDKALAIIRRRISNGQHFCQPYLGCREFDANFGPFTSCVCSPALAGERDLGYMLHSVDYSIHGNPTPRFYRAVMHDGVINVPPVNSPEVLS